MPSKWRNRLIWAAMLALLVVLGFRTREHFITYFARVGTLDVQPVPSEGSVYLRWRGKIDAPMASRLSAAFDRYKDETRTFVLSLNSPGGSLDQGAEVVRLLRRIRETRTLVTYVDGGDICASMCVPVYLQGSPRVAAANARFMFHAVSFRDFFTKERDRSVPNAAIGRETDRFFVKYFEAAGVSPEWLGKVRTAIERGSDVWETGQELVDEKSGVVQKLQ